jgi:hypothetical protein
MGQQAGPSVSMSAMNTEMHKARPGRRRRLQLTTLRPRWAASAGLKLPAEWSRPAEWRRPASAWLIWPGDAGLIRPADAGLKRRTGLKRAAARLKRRTGLKRPAGAGLKCRTGLIPLRTQRATPIHNKTYAQGCRRERQRFEGFSARHCFSPFVGQRALRRWEPGHLPLPQHDSSIGDRSTIWAGLFWLLGRSNGRFRRFAPGCQHKYQPKPVLLIGDSSPPIRGSYAKERNSALVANIGFEPPPISPNPYCTVYRVGDGLEYSPAFRPECPAVPKGDLVEPSGHWLGVHL